ncbi:hypothetical protein BX616_009201 [Lobosporangium transversale]|nr:hypothetical protein BX616_009201 [Lobosporangium transversale]
MAEKSLSSTQPVLGRRRSGSIQDTSGSSAPPTKKALFSIFEKKHGPLQPASICWETYGSSFIVGRAFEPKAGAKVAAFDLDHTLIKVNGKHKWPKNADDWVWWTPCVPTQLKEVADAGYILVVITNQNGLDGNVQKQNEMRSKFEKICACLGLPMWVLISMQKDQNRKPMTGLWHWLESRFLGDGVEIDYTVSYYVGDAAGRHDGWKAGAIKDFNNTDRKFAATLGIQFHTPEHFFLGQACPDNKWSYGSFDPKAWPKDAPLFSPSSTPLLPNPGTVEVIVFCGYPASGKSSFARKYILSTGQYDYINQDTLKTKEKCIKATEESLQKNRAVVVDNTNPDRPTRESYINLAKKYNVPVRCFLFMANKDLAMHNNYFRAFHRPLLEAMRNVEDKKSLITTQSTATPVADSSTEMTSSNDNDGGQTHNPSSVTVTLTKVREEPVRERLPDMVFSSYAKRYQEPTVAEGFSEIKKINFIPDKDIKDAWERWYF